MANVEEDPLALTTTAGSGLSSGASGTVAGRPGADAAALVVVVGRGGKGLFELVEESISTSSRLDADHPLSTLNRA